MAAGRSSVELGDRSLCGSVFLVAGDLGCVGARRPTGDAAIRRTHASVVARPFDFMKPR
jgi:hypothetical protein